MSELLVWKGKLQEFYAKRTTLIDKTLQFILALAAFVLINQNIGVFEAVMSPVVSLGLAVVCTFLPPIAVVLAAAGLVLLHLFSISLGVMAVSFLIFFVMFIFYCRFTPKRAMILLLTPLAFWLKIPYAVPIICGLALSPASAMPVAFGTIIHFMLSYVKNSSAALSSADGIVGQITLFVKAVFLDKELWITCFAFILCVFAVYAIRRREIDYAWKIAIAVGAVINMSIIVVGSMFVNVEVSYANLIVGNIVAIVIGMVLEFFIFSVDYSRSERLQFEDDEYYYYVKAIPKISIASPEKKVKTINERKDSEDEHETIKKIRPKKSEPRRIVKKKVEE